MVHMYSIINMFFEIIYGQKILEQMTLTTHLADKCCKDGRMELMVERDDDAMADIRGLQWWLFGTFRKSYSFFSFFLS